MNRKFIENGRDGQKINVGTCDKLIKPVDTRNEHVIDMKDALK